MLINKFLRRGTCLHQHSRMHGSSPLIAILTQYTMAAYKRVSYIEFAPEWLIEPRWLNVLMEVLLYLTGVGILLALYRLFLDNYQILHLLVFAIVVSIPLFLVAIFYSVRIYDDGQLVLLRFPFRSTYSLRTLEKCSLCPVRTRYRDLYYIECCFVGKTPIRLCVKDKQTFLSECQKYNPSLQIS